MTFSGQKNVGGIRVKLAWFCFGWLRSLTELSAISIIKNYNGSQLSYHIFPGHFFPMWLTST